MSQKNNSISFDKKSGSVWVLILGTASINLFFSTRSKDPFNTPKLILLLIVSGWLLGHIVKFIRKDFKVFTTTQKYGLIVISAFLVFMFVSSLTSGTFLLALIGETQRRNGLLSYIGLAVILVFAMLVINFNYAIRLYKIAMINGLILGLYGLIQTFGRDFITWSNPYNALIGTLGNPNFTSAILAVFATLAVATLMLKEISPSYKFLSLAVFIVSVFCIYRSNSRQGFVSLGFALMFYVTVYFYLRRRIFGIILAASSSLITLVCVLGMLQVGPLTSVLYKPSVSIRGHYWNAAIEMFKSNPFKGVGIDAYGNYFREFRDINYPLNYGFEITSSNAHNVFLQFFATGGIFLGVSYVALTILILSFGMIGLRNSKGDERAILLGILSGWLAYQATSFISIDNIGITVWNWLLGGVVLGLASSVSQNHKEKEFNSARLKPIKRNQLTVFQPAISILVLIPILIFAIFLNRSETNTFKVIAYSSDPIKYRELIYKHSQEVYENPISDPNHRLDCSLAMIDAGYFSEGYAEIKKLEKLNPRSEYVLVALSEISEIQKDLLSAIDYRIKLSKIDPFNGNNYFKLMVLYKNTGDLIQAAAIQVKINDLFPNSQISADAQKELAT